ncbi:MAG: hypothetical protein V4644_01480 [Patescibacteria group bacterium]
MRNVLIATVTAAASLVFCTSVQAQSIQTQTARFVKMHQHFTDQWLISMAEYWDASGRPTLATDPDGARAICSSWDSGATARQQHVRSTRAREMVQLAYSVSAYQLYARFNFEESISLQRQFHLVDELCDTMT